MNPIASGAYLGIRPICVCGHYDSSHEQPGRCHNRDNGQACQCRVFVDRETDGAA